MKCLCYNQSFADQFSVKEHYVTCHNDDENNFFFRKLFIRDEFFVPRKCFCCGYVCLNRRDEKNHNFFTHYQMGSRQPNENKPLTKTNFDKNLRRYSISFCEHGDYYDF